MFISSKQWVLFPFKNALNNIFHIDFLLLNCRKCKNVLLEMWLTLWHISVTRCLNFGIMYFSLNIFIVFFLLWEHISTIFFIFKCLSERRSQCSSNYFLSSFFFLFFFSLSYLLFKLTPPDTTGKMHVKGNE